MNDLTPKMTPEKLAPLLERLWETEKAAGNCQMTVEVAAARLREDLAQAGVLPPVVAELIAQVQKLAFVHGATAMLHSGNRAALESKLAAAREALQCLGRYVAAEGRPDGDVLRVGLANGSVWGPSADPTYEMYELAEAVEAWLHRCVDAALAALDRTE